MNDLFMVEDEADRAKLERCTKLRVKRLEMGKWVYAPIAYEPTTLETMEQLHEIFGGGDYMIEARDADNTFLKNVRLQLPGRPKPLAPEPEPEERAPVATAPAAPVISENGMLMQFMMAQMQQTTQILTAVLTRGDSSSDKLLIRSQALEDRARAEHSEFMKTLLERAQTVAAAQPSAGGSQESFMAGIEFAQGLFTEMANKQGEGESPADFMSSMTQFMHGLSTLGQTTAGGGPGVPNGAG